MAFLWYKVKYIFLLCTKEDEVPAEVAFCKGKVKGAKPHKMAEIDSGRQKTV